MPENGKCKMSNEKWKIAGCPRHAPRRHPGSAQSAFAGIEERIFHLSFAIFHSSFVGPELFMPENGKCKMSNDKWKIFPSSAVFC
jgi:hypothetical protein